MSSILIDARGEPVEDRWLAARDGDAAPAAAAAGASGLLLPLAAYLERPPSPLLGVLLAPDDDPARLGDRLHALPLVAIDFPKFADGRGYSQAALLRRAGYRGELRATGDVLIDQLRMLARVGFSSFALRADQKLADARAALARFADPYQGAADLPLPAFRRHPRPAATDRFTPRASLHVELLR